MESIIILVVKVILCHLVGDYVLQSDYIARTKGENWYHLFVHCALYCIPFMVVFNDYLWCIYFIFISHVIIDSFKARYKTINYVEDQLLHYIVLIGFCVVMISVGK